MLKRSTGPKVRLSTLSKVSPTATTSLKLSSPYLSINLLIR